MLIDRPAPDFTLPDTQGSLHKLSNHRGHIVVLNFWSCECPHSERTDAMLVESLRTWDERVALLSIASNRNESAQSVESARVARSLPMVLIDANHAVADVYEAVTTPHIYVIDGEGILRYRGAVDDVTFRQRKSTRIYLDEAVGSLLNGQRPTLTETPAYGCTIVREI